MEDLPTKFILINNFNGNVQGGSINAGVRENSNKNQGGQL